MANNLGFEVIEADEMSVVLQKALKPNNRSKKEMDKIKANLPTATVHCFHYNDYIKLKEIEKEILGELSEQRRKKISASIGKFF